MKVLLISLITTLLFFSCKTREDIAREQMINSMANQMQDGQKLQADFTSRVQFLEERLSKITGKVEEGDHRTAQTLETRMKSIEERLELLEAQFKNNNEKLSAFDTKLDQQGKYIKSVLSTLKGLSSKKRSSKASTPYQQAMKNYQSGKYKTAKKMLIPLLKNKKMSAVQKTRILHNLGMIEYMEKKNQEAIIYFSRLFTEHPKSAYNKRGLLFLAKTFVRQKKTSEAKQTLNELIARYPKAKQVKEAKKLLGKL